MLARGIALRLPPAAPLCPAAAALGLPCALPFAAGLGEVPSGIPGWGKAIIPFPARFFYHLRAYCPSRVNLRGARDSRVQFAAKAMEVQAWRSCRSGSLLGKQPLGFNRGRAEPGTGARELLMAVSTKCHRSRGAAGVAGGIRKGYRKCSQATVLCKSLVDSLTRNNPR